MSESVNPIFDLSYQEQKDTSIDSVNYIKLFDTNNGFSAVNNPPQNHFTFRLNDINSYYRYAHSFFHFECQAFQSNGNDMGVISSDIRSALSRVVFRINSEVVEDKPAYFYREAEWDRDTWSLQYRSLIGSDMNIDDINQVGTDLITNAGDFSSIGNPDVDGQFALCLAASTVDGTGTGDTTNVEKGMLRRANFINTTQNATGRLWARSKGQMINCFVPFYHLFNVAKVWDRVIKGCPLEVEFFITPNEICTLQSPLKKDGVTAADGTTTLRWVGPGITWNIPRIIPSPMVEARLNAQLLAGLSIPIKFEKSYMYRYNIGTGDAASQQWRIVNTASRPTRLVVFHRPQETESNQQKPLRGDGTNASACVLTKANLFINGTKVPSEDVTADVGQLTQAGITGPLPGNQFSGENNETFNTTIIARDVTQQYRMYNEMLSNYTEPYMRNFGMVAGKLDYTNFATSPYYCYDLSKRELGQFVGGAAEVTLDFSLGYVPDQNGGTRPPLYLYALLYTESEMTLSMTEHSTRVLVR